MFKAGRVRVLGAGAAMLVGAALFFVWGAATVQKHVWPYPLLRQFGDRPSAEATSLTNRVRRTIFKRYRKPVDIVFLGDSVTAQAPWNEMFPDISLANRGIGGERFENMLTRLDDIIALNPTAVFIMGGINSAGRESVEDALADLDEIVSTLRAAGIKVHLQTTIIPRGDRRPFVLLLNSQLSAYADEAQLPLIDLGVLADEDGLPEAYSIDGTHLTGEGYLVWERALQAHLEDALSS